MTSARISRVWGTIVLTTIIFSLSYPAYAKYSGGTGEPNDPYQIATAEDLILLGESPEDYDKHFILTADIDLDPNLPGRKVFDKAVIAPHLGREWSGMNRFEGTRFTGVFDGKGHTISHLTINGRGDLGLFGRSGDNAKIRSIGLVDLDITGLDSDIYVGGLVGYNDGSIITSYGTGAIIGGDYVGGLVGLNYGTITMSYSTSRVSGADEVGGLVGSSSSPAVFQCYSSGQVRGKTRNVGGLAGGGLGNIALGSFWDIQSSGQLRTIGGGTGLTTNEMQTVTTFIEAGWDFWGEASDGLHEIWHMPEGGGYPVLAIFNGYTPPQLQESGTPDDPYLVTDVMELGATIYHNPDSHYRLAASLDLFGIRWGMAIIPRFAGTFDGNGHILYNLTITGERQVGLFGELHSGAEVRDLGLVDANITGSSYGVATLAADNFGDVIGCYSTGLVSGGNNVGGLVGRNGDQYQYTESSGTITDCDSAATVNGNERVGGLVGSNSGSVATSFSSGAVSGNSYVGGLVGSNGQGRIVASYATGTVDGNGSIGGLVGSNDQGRIVAGYATGAVGGSGEVGGLAGSNDQGSIVRSYATGSVGGNGDVGGLVGSNGQGSIITSCATCAVDGNDVVGGLAGSNDGTIAICYSSGAVGGTSSIGGLVGDNGQGSIITSYATCVVDGNDAVGGLVGSNSGGIIISYSSGAVSGISDVGGFAGSNSGTITKSFWDTETSGQLSSAGGTGLITADMQNIDIFLNEGWDFIDEVINGTCNYWRMSPGEYPSLHFHFGEGPLMPEGLGTAEQPYLIRDARDLGTVWFEPMANYRLEVSLDLSGITWSIAVIPWFDGTIDGNGHSINNLYIQGAGYLGLFGQLASDSEVKTLGIVDCNVTGGGACVGGLAGNNSGIVTQSFCTGAVSGTENVGGLVGGNAGTVMQCYATVEVSGSSIVGGLTGDNVDGKMSHSYSIGMVSGDEGTGGLMGRNTVYSRGFGTRQGIVIECFWDIETSGQETSDGGIGKTTAEMQTGATFYNWGINGNEGIWTIDEGKDYPQLWWENRPGQPIATWLSDFLEGQGTQEDPYVIYTIEDVNMIMTLPSEHRRYFRLGFLTGEGTQENPYLIETAEQIALITMCPYESKWDAHFKLGFVTGAGTQENPYSIYTIDQLNLLSICPYELDKNFKLMANIDLSGIAYSPSVIPEFKGTFDGDGHRISNLTITTGENYVGLFGKLEFGAEVRDLAVVDVNVTGSSGDFSGFEWPAFYVGGLVGYNDGGSVICCYSTGVVGGSSFRVGGLIGQNHGKVMYCNSTVTVISSDFDVGGLIGNNWDDGIVSFCYSTGAVTGDSYVGGLVGDNHGNINACYSTGSINGDSYVGGLVGDNWGNGTVNFCYSTGAVTGDYDVGGLVGGGVECVSHSVWDMETSGVLGSAGGVGLTTAEMMGSYMLGLNGFANDPNWILDAGRDYPRLAWEGTVGQIIPEPGIDWLEGNGTTENPYRIDTAKQLVMLGRASAFCDRHFVLGADIDLDPNIANGQVFSQAVIPTFDGIFDGGGHCISHLTVTGGTKLGLFGRLESGAEVKDLGVTAAKISGSGTYSVYIGELAGYNLGTVSNCYSNGVVIGTGQFSAVGGLVGYNDKGSVTDCYSTATVTVIGTNLSSPIGGLIGENRGSVSRCYSIGIISGSKDVGGLVGSNSWCGDLDCCYSTGVRIGESRVGGLVGSNFSFVTQCYSSGSVSGAENVGGLTGTNGHRIVASYSSGNVNGTSAVGGLVGYNQAEVIRCYSTGLVSGAWPGGGLTGGQAFFSKYVYGSFWDTQTSGQDTSYGGTGKTTTEMQTADTFLEAGWDFVDETENGTEDIWWILEGQDCPRLWWELIPEN